MKMHKIHPRGQFLFYACVNFGRNYCYSRHLKYIYILRFYIMIMLNFFYNGDLIFLQNGSYRFYASIINFYFPTDEND